jgi:hypothetical protein
VCPELRGAPGWCVLSVVRVEAQIHLITDIITVRVVRLFYAVLESVHILKALYQSQNKGAKRDIAIVNPLNVVFLLRRVLEEKLGE